MKSEKAKKENIVDINQLLTVTNFCKQTEMKRQTAYYQVKVKHIKSELVDEVPFIYKKEVKKFKKKL